MDSEYNYLKNTKFLGNGALLKKSQNSKTNNNEIWVKIEYYNNAIFLSNSIFDGQKTKNEKNKEIYKLNPLYTEKIKELIKERKDIENNNTEESILKGIEKSIYDKFVENIKKRTNQMIDILCEMYKYDVNSKSQDEKNTNK